MRDYNDIYPYLSDEAKEICALSDKSRDFILGSLDFRLFGVRLRLRRLGVGEISDEEWDTYTIEDIEKIIGKYGCSVLGYDPVAAKETGDYRWYEYSVQAVVDNYLKYSYILKEAREKANPDYDPLGHYDNYEDYGAHNGR